MTESAQTKKFHPTPARNEPSSKDGKQSDGASSAVAGSGNHPRSPNVIQENQKTEKGYEDLKKGQKNTQKSTKSN
jgi:hypothetical protein